MKLVKAITALTIQELETKINAINKIRKSFATQVFIREEKGIQWYEALCYYEESDEEVKK
jgi:hypothetical protein